MPASALAEFFGFTLYGILEKLKGKWFWITIAVILIILLGLVIYLD